MDFNEKGILAFQEKRYEEAAQAFNDAIEANPDDAVGYINFGNLLASLEEVDRAERFFQKALTIDTTAATAYYGLANLYYNATRFTEAARLYKEAITHELEGADAYYMLAKSLEKENKHTFALPYMQRAAELAKEDVQIQLSYGILLCTLEMFKEAEPQLQYVITLDGLNADAYYNLGVLYAVSTEDTEKALQHLTRAYEIEPAFEQAKYMIDLIEQRLN